MAYHYIKSSIKIANLTIAYNLGGIFDQEGRKGISHLMEHLVCKTFKDEYDRLNRYGIEFNAMTGDNLVKVYFEGVEKYFTPEWRRRLVEKLIGGINISEEEFETEKKVVLQEYMDCFNEPANAENTLRLKFGYYGAIGKREDIENFTYSDMKEFYDRHMRKPWKIVEVGPSKTDFSDIPMVEEFVDLPLKPKYKKCWNIPLESSPENSKLDVTFLCKKCIHKGDYPALVVAVNMLNGGLESPMMKEIREKRGLTYNVSSSFIKFMSYAYTAFGATTDKGNGSELKDAFRYFFNDIGEHLDKERFEDVICALDVENEKDNIFKYRNVNRILNKGRIQVGNSYKRLTFEKVVEVAKKYLTMENMDVIEE